MKFQELFDYLSENYGEEVSWSARLQVEKEHMEEIEQRSDSLEDLLISGFSWYDSPEGGRFWGNIFDKITTE